MKVRAPLTAEQQILVVEAMPLCRAVAKRYLKSWREMDFEGACYLKICQRISSYDPSRSSFSAWVVMVSSHACMDLIRSEFRTRFKIKAKFPSVVSLDVP